ncbi:RnfABCDGE type electron transport complex subunit G [Thermoanaerobacterium thermosaccharolyticum]|uniref:Ion-translocating oxidoreductase complex subunit G n=1 Tax=Thermoanaerobacterium thermosaccharolyticum (strain ATCC 7956 / DSM 571 / NCIMB 9385 / NCA 3814 / NCTC 13789 / WDCM 00135 / 2032) TaxID=580327 RepID=D9TM08_THETC|nr:RnfABCDGE type electron transport complex subunit G [Thermoanaerobacterium thermosaccharolyticum]ADL68388.1 electron transport complex, RnfABCDGE type, G subunit [Thermoanaerobacterium thermosaccharolyticum DSM 571]KAA5808283.1 RnfABCDGE type electron transport complex subunit G [Thermoanaerobacterium thermosaccharolyticum]
MSSKNDILKTGITLLIITGIAAIVLGFFNFITEKPIAKQLENTNMEAMKAVLPAEQYTKLDLSKYKFNFDTSGDPKLTPDSRLIEEINEAKSNGNVVGYVIKVAPKGFSGPVDEMIGINKDGKITGITIVNQSETPGLGAKSEDPNWNKQYKGKNADKDLVVVKTVPSQDNQIQAITGATITSRAVTKGVNTAIEAYRVIAGSNK